MPYFYDNEGEVHEMEDVNVQIVPGTNLEAQALATNKNIGIVANTLGGVSGVDSTYIHAPYSADLTKAKISGVEKIHTNAIKHTIGHPSFNEFANEAYASERGYAIRKNPVTGQNEMFIPGTRNGQDWISNSMEIRPVGGKYYAAHMFADLADSEKFHDAADHHATPWREEAQRYYSDIAHANQVDVIYGHSRGGAIVADMETDPGVQKVGLDAAMVIADNKDMLNYYEAGEGSGRNAWSWLKSRFDAGIGISGKNNKHMNLSKKMHHAWGD